MELILEVVSYEQMLARINDDVNNFKTSWGHFLIYTIYPGEQIKFLKIICNTVVTMC